MNKQISDFDPKNSKNDATLVKSKKLTKMYSLYIINTMKAQRLQNNC